MININVSIFALLPPFMKIAVCFLIRWCYFGGIYHKQYGSHSDCSLWSSLIWIHIVCFHDKSKISSDDVFWWHLSQTIWMQIRLLHREQEQSDLDSNCLFPGVHLNIYSRHNKQTIFSGLKICDLQEEETKSMTTGSIRTIYFSNIYRFCPQELHQDTYYMVKLFLLLFVL